MIKVTFSDNQSFWYPEEYLRLLCSSFINDSLDSDGIYLLMMTHQEFINILEAISFNDHERLSRYQSLLLSLDSPYYNQILDHQSKFSFGDQLEYTMQWMSSMKL